MAANGLSQMYAFTVTLSPKNYRNNAEVQYDDTWSHVLHKLRNICNNVSLVAELTKASNIHYHGLCNFTLTGKNLIKQFNDHFRCRCKNRNVCKCITGFVNIKVCDNQPGWVEYMCKDVEETRQSISRPPVIFDQIKVLPRGMFITQDFEL